MTATMNSPAGEAGLTQPKIEFDRVTKVYRTDSGDQVVALAETSLTVTEGEFICIVGPSGCGKSTLMQMLAGFHHPTTGRVLVDGVPVTKPDRNRGVVFQQANLYPWLTTRQNVELGPRLSGVGRVERRQCAEYYLDMVGLAKFADRKPYELSGGMQQRAQIARVLATDPALLLMDEPFGALDALTRLRLQDELRRLWLETGKTVVFITHSVDEAAYLGSRVLVMSPRPGRLVLDEPTPYGRTTELPDNPRSTPEFIAFRDRVADAIHAPA